MRYHLIGIGGIGMSGIAHLLLQRGMQVSGSDLKETSIIAGLQKLGAPIFLGHNASNVQGADLIVYSSAIGEDNPEIQEAKRLGIRLIKRAQALADLMQDKLAITVTGSHGKTTTTSLVSHLLLEAGLMPTVAIGGIFKNIDANAYFGSGKYFVAEADESDGSFLYYRPRYSIITNIDHEHLDYYGDFNNVIKAFKEFIHNTEEGGCIFPCYDDLNLMAILRNYNKRYITFGLEEGADISAKNIAIQGLSSEFDCFCKGKFIDRFNLSLGGKHNVSNALAVIALGLELGISLEILKKTLYDYKGARRRLEVKFKSSDYMIIDDYAHHPTEIKASLAAIKDLKRKRVIAVFQPHRYSRAKLLLEEFSRCFELADYVIITNIYAAGEKPLEGVSGSSIYEKIKAYAPGKEVYFLAREEILAHILKIIKPQDLVVTLGAGDITKTSDELAERLKS